MPELSELEGAVLGTIHVEGPCTAYAVRKTFRKSPSPHWSGSACAIYPLIHRLEKRGLVRSKPKKKDARRGRLYRLTPAGLRIFRSWLAPPHPDWVIGVPVDALRTRVRFLLVLPSEQRSAFLEEALARLREHIEEVIEDCRVTSDLSDPCPHLVARGALASLTARKSWLEEVRDTLGEGGAFGSEG